MGQKRLPALNLLLARKLLLAQNLLLAQKLMPAAKSLLSLKKSEFYFIFYQFNRTRIWKRCIPLHPELFYYTFYLSNGPKIDTSSKFAASTKIAAGTKTAASTKNGARNKNAASIKIALIFSRFYVIFLHLIVSASGNDALLYSLNFSITFYRSNWPKMSTSSNFGATQYEN